MSKGSEESEEELERKSIFTSVKNRVSKIGTGIKSAAEYGLVEGVGKTIKNFASGVSSGAKQGYGYFTTDRNMHSAVEDTFQKVERLANIPKETATDFYQKLGEKEKFFILLSEFNSKLLKQELNNDSLLPLEEIVKNQIKDLSVLTLDNKYNTLLTEPKYTELAPQDKLNRLIDISSDIFNKMHDERKKMHDERAKQPDFIAQTRKIEMFKEELDKRILPNLAGAAEISNSEAYKNAQTYEEKIDLIRIKLEADKKKSIPQSHINDSKSKIQNFAKKDQQLTNTSFEEIKRTVNDLRAARSHNRPPQHPIELQLKRLETAKQTLADLRAAEAELFKPKQNRVVRTLKTAAGLMAGAVIGIARGAGRGTKTTVQAVKNAPNDIKTTYQQNRNKQQNTR